MKNKDLIKLVSRKEKEAKVIKKEKKLRKRALKNNICPDCGKPTSREVKNMAGWFSGGEIGEVTRVVDTCPNGHIHIKKHYGCFD